MIVRQLHKLIGLIPLCLGFALTAALETVDARAGDLPPLKTGDIVFQDPGGELGLAIMLATHSPYTHVGLIEIDKKGRPLVIEAAKSVRTVPLERWIRNGTLKRLTVKRMRGLSEEAARKAVARAHTYDGRPYDFFFYETREALYCSELVYAAFKEGAGIDVGKVERVRELAIGSAAVREVIEDRWRKHPLCQSPGNKTFDACYAAILEQTLVTPASIASDPQLETVYSNFGLAGN